MDSTSFVDALLEALESDEKELFHYGRKGMRWGIRRTPAQLGRASAPGQEKKDGEVVVRTTKRGGKIRKVDADLDGDGKDTPAVFNAKTKRVVARTADAVEKEKVDAILKEFGTDAVPSARLKSYAARVELERKINTLNPPAQNPAKAFVADLLQKDREKIINSGDYKQTSTYAMYAAGAAAIAIAKAKAKEKKS